MTQVRPQDRRDVKREERKPLARPWTNEPRPGDLDVVRVPVMSGIADDVALM